MRGRRTFGFRSLLLGALFACDEGDAHFTTKLASDLTPSHRTVSVLGIYKDGRMSSDDWQALAPRVAPALGAVNCDVGYDILSSANGALADAIDEYARANGPTDDLLAQLAPFASLFSVRRAWSPLSRCSTRGTVSTMRLQSLPRRSGGRFQTSCA